MEHTEIPSFKYFKKLGEDLVSESQNPHDRYHLGKLILKQLREHPDRINQIDATTDEHETNGSVLERSTATARAITSQGLQVGDVAVLMSLNNLDIAVPFIACMYVGVVPVAIDPHINEKDVLKKYLAVAQPKIVFCAPENASLVTETSHDLGVSIIVVTLGKGEAEGYDNLKQFISQFSSKKQCDEFEAISFDTYNTLAIMHFTSGTTGTPKATVHTHYGFSVNLPYIWRFIMYVFRNRYDCKTIPGHIRLALMMTPLKWISSTSIVIHGAIYLFPRVQYPVPHSRELVYDVINKYKPSWCFLSINNCMLWMEYPNRLSCDFSCFDTFMVGGNPIVPEVVGTIKSLMGPGGAVKNTFGSSEAGGNIFLPNSVGPIRSVGKPAPTVEYKLVDIITGEELGANKPGELWIRGDLLFKEYFKNAEETKAVFTPDRWYRTGDMLYKDEEDYYYFVDRIKLLMKCQSWHVSPIEIEDVIRQHPAVRDVAVCGYVEPGLGDLPTAFVVAKKESLVTAQEIKDFVKGKLDEIKHLHGGVIFVKEIPLTVTSKVDRVKLKKLVRILTRE